VNKNFIKKFILLFSATVLLAACIGLILAAKVPENWIGIAMLGAFSTMCFLPAIAIK